jgi:hypothetical protein
MSITVKKARTEDAAEVANVHVNAWREAYQGILDSSCLNERPLNFKKHYELWTKLINQNEIVYIAECDKYGIVDLQMLGKVEISGLKMLA